MNILITGESGFIAENLKRILQRRGHTVSVIDDANILKIKTGETCVHRNSSSSWAWHFKNLGVDLVVHNAAVVGTDVVALNPSEATLTSPASRIPAAPQPAQPRPIPQGRGSA